MRITYVQSRLNNRILFVVSVFMYVCTGKSTRARYKIGANY